MAQEGIDGFAAMFRFMVLFTTSHPKHLSKLSAEGKRLQAPLRIPAVLSWSDKDENHPYTEYEEMVLYVAQDYREVIRHQDGHIPCHLGVAACYQGIMDFDDLDEVEAAAGPTPEERARDLLAAATPEPREIPVPRGRNFGEDGKMKMLFLYGGGTNASVGRMQVLNVFKETEVFKSMQFTVMEAPTKTNVKWHFAEAMQQQLAPFGPDMFLYFDRVPYSNSQHEAWEGIEASFEALRAHFKEHGPYDGVVGFDMGGEVLVQAARMAQEGIDGFAAMFRFMVLFTTSHPKHLSRFLRTMQTGATFQPSVHADNARFRNLWLPLCRVAPAGRGAELSGTTLLVVTDPMGSHDYHAVLAALGRAIQTGRVPAPKTTVPFEVTGFGSIVADITNRLAVSILSARDFAAAAAGGGLRVQGITYSDEQRRHRWHCGVEEVLNGQMRVDDIILDEGSEAMARRWADELMQPVETHDYRISIVGLGTGAWIALACARLLIQERKVVPDGLWLIDPPTRLPDGSSSQPGYLVDCPMRVLINADSMVGPPWRYEVATCGPFSMAEFKNAPDAVRMVIEECSAL
eukprot:NODE_3614_length_2010_cov_8.795539.p1 GENE.NODE_3614_length_2010_cov_8.795539~~NODE_3614_length_2010_cov_8.795539.p1  ORF type:complete len:588 (+),score=209.67 NODE_3614_length_2010_cov_8.795539:44-1765(+)